MRQRQTPAKGQESGDCAAREDKSDSIPHILWQSTNSTSPRMTLTTAHANPISQATTFRELGQNIVQRSLPAFGLTLQEVLRVTESDSMSGQQVSEIILRDPSLTSRVLRAANAAHLGYSGSTKVVTVSRAVVVLGINSVRSLCVSAMAVENMAATTQFRHHVQAALGVALHAAVQARDMGIRQGARKEDSERLFVEALLSGIGEMAFWCYGESFAERLDQALNSGMPPVQAEQTVLGTTLRQFSRELLQAWNLGSVMRASPEVALAQRLSLATQKGWLTPEARLATQAIEGLLKQPGVDTLLRLKENARQAAILATALGANEAVLRIPEAGPQAVELPEPHFAVGNGVGLAYPEPNLQLQLRMLTEMANVASSRKDLPMLFEACLEGLHRAVGLDRCVLCLLTPARDQLLARMATGIDVSDLRSRLKLNWTPSMDADLQPGRASWLSGSATPLTFLQQASGVADCFMATVSVDREAIGLFYADCQPSGRPLSDEGFESFRSFIVQVEMAVRALSR